MAKPYPKIEFRKVRDFGETLNVSALFLRQNFKPIMRHLLILAGPFMLVGSVAPVLTLNRASVPSSYAIDPVSQFFASYGVNVIALFIGLFMAVTVVYQYILLYTENDPDHPEVEFNLLWKAVRRSFLRVLFHGIILSVIFAIGIVLLFALAGAILTPFALALSTNDSLWKGIIIFLLVAAMLTGILLICSPALLLLLPASLHERTGFFSAFSRSYALVQGHWWPAAGLVFICTALTFSFNLIPKIPATILQFSSATLDASSASSVTYLTIQVVITGILGSAISLLMMSVNITVGTAYYFSLVENKESVGLLERIQAMGTEANQTTTSAPDDSYAEEERY